MKKLFLAFALAIFLASGFAQEQKKGLIISLEPAYVAINGLKSNIEFQLNSPSHWIVIGPQLYHNGKGSNDNFSTNFYDKMSGYGLDIYHKFYGGARNIPNGVYMGYGITGKYYMLEYAQESWMTTQKNSQEVFIPEEIEVEHNIVKYGLNVVVGYQYIIDNFMSLDMYIGTGIRYTHNNANIDDYRELNENFFSVGYNGITLLGGLKFGMIIR